MAREGQLVVRGYRDLIKSLATADKSTRRMVRKELREAGDVVRAEAAHLFEPVNPHSAAGYRVVVRQRGVAVEQSLRKTTGLHPEYGKQQMRVAFIPALKRKGPEIVTNFERAIERITARATRR